jgi:hypothetical protein
MAVKGQAGTHKRVHKNTCQNGSKTSTANKSNKTRKAYRGQGR